MEGSKADVMRQLGDAILRHVHELQPRDMSVTWNAFRRDVMHERLFQGLLKRLPAIAERFSAVQIGMTLNALGHFRIRHEQSISSLISRAKLLLGTGSPVDHVSALGEGVPKGRSSIGDTSRFGVHNLAMLLNSAARLDSVDSLLASDDGLSILVLQAVKRTVTQIFVSRGDCHEVQNLFFRDKLLPAANSRFRCCTAVLHRSGEPQPVRQEEGGTSMRGGGPYLHSKIHFKECPQDLTPQALGNIALGLGFVLANLCSFPLHGSGFHEGVRSDLQQYISLCNRCIVVLSTLSVRIFPVNPRPPPAVVTEVSSGFASLSRDAVEEGSATQVLEPAHRFQFLQALLCMWHFRGGLAPEEHG
ncbi:conserved hypothetical protein [Neospora caninum Liverpool]|nr:conserved hypothetical protein [Neospora caninum Liverpool]CBZ51028.1 conserved hypothetical protein [Neospora caninum Liverpool]|eukprot:XP_003881061.1 conserved hypothetical protein [Neospora caninum Liverpool]